MQTATPSTTAPDSPSLASDLAIAALVLAIFGAVLLPRLGGETQAPANPLHDIAAAAGSLKSAASLQRAEQLTQGGPVQRDLDAPQSGALKIVSRPIAPEDCVALWNNLLPEGPVATTGQDAPFSVLPTTDRGVCRYHYAATAAQTYTISYRPDSGQVAYD